MSTNVKKPFPPDAGDFIPQTKAEKLRESYCEHEKKKHKHDDFLQAYFFGKDKLMELLNFRKDIVGLRIYYGVDLDGDGIEDKKMVIYAVDKEGKNILYNLPKATTAGLATTDGTDSDEGEGMALDGGLPCPQSCP